jgi:hypothetical protein
MSNILLIENGAVTAPDIDGWTVDYMSEQDFANCLSNHNAFKDSRCDTSPSEYGAWNSRYKMICYKSGSDLIGIVLRGDSIICATSNISDGPFVSFMVNFLNTLNAPVTLRASVYQSYYYNLYLQIGKTLGINYKSRANLNVFIWEIK